MPCTTILVGKKASHDGSTMIARTDDGHFDVKKLVTVAHNEQPRKYKSAIGHLEIDLPEDPMRYTACPSVDKKNGIWAATGINEANVAMTATETITTNPRVMGRDPLVVYKKAEKEGECDTPGGIGEEDIVVLVLPYIKSAREGAVRLGGLLEKYGTYESNGIAFSDENEIWWLETIGGHHWIAKRVKDEECVIMPNQFGLDDFDLADALGEGREHLCSKDLKEFLDDNFLDLNFGDKFDPRYAFGSHSTFDRVYNTPRAWYMGRYLNPTRYKWEGENADFTPASDNIPWSFVPEKKLTPEDVKFLLSSHYEGTPYDVYSASAEKKGIYRPIGINRTGVTALCQIRGYMPKELKSVEWVCFGSTSFAAFLPVYTNVERIPAYLEDVSMDVSTENFYWNSRLLGALTDPHYGSAIGTIERYQNRIAGNGYRIIGEYDAKMMESGDYSLTEEANDKLADMAKQETKRCLNDVLATASERMKNGFNRWDN